MEYVVVVVLCGVVKGKISTVGVSESVPEPPFNANTSYYSTDVL
jgi:hypothetical protein